MTNDHPITKSKFYQAGYRSFLNGSQLKDNPYQYKADDCMKSGAWVTGWKQAEKDNASNKN